MLTFVENLIVAIFPAGPKNHRRFQMHEVGPQSPSDNKFVAKCRLHQSKYRCEVLKEDYGHGPTKNSSKRYGNFLVDGEQTGSNFVSKAAYRYAIQRTLDKNINKDLTIDSYRLFNNMMSSMPMCFNLFSDLREFLSPTTKRAQRYARNYSKKYLGLIQLNISVLNLFQLPLKSTQMIKRHLMPLSSLKTRIRKKVF